MRQKLVLTKYQVKLNIPSASKGRSSIHFALVTDLHDQNPILLLRKLKIEKPDYILIAGDTMERNMEGYDGHTMKEIDSFQHISPLWSLFCRILKRTNKILKSFGISKKGNPKYGPYFLKKASEIAPVYMSIGNHEWYYLPEDYVLMEECGIHLLDNQDITLPETLQGQAVHIGGFSTRYDTDWLNEYSQKEGIKILLSHHPEYYKRFITNVDGDFDLVLSGHAHGGQWRFFGRGILAPGQGFFPEYHHGRFGNLIVSSGVSNPSVIPRWGNPCELVLIDLS